MSATVDRGYGYQHRRLRERWRKQVERGGVICARCGHPIEPGERWHLDHDSHDRSRYLGPSHERCNCGEPGKRRRKRRHVNPNNHSRDW